MKLSFSFRASAVLLSGALHLALGASVMALRPPSRPVMEQPVPVILTEVRKGTGPGGGGAGVKQVARPAAPPVKKQRKKRPPRRPPPPPEAPPPVVTKESNVAVATPEPDAREPDPEPASEPSANERKGSSEGATTEGGTGEGAGGGAGEGTGDGGSPFGTGEAVDVKQAAVHPKLEKSVRPKYPRRARARNVEGVVVLRVVVGIDGRVEPDGTRVVRSVPSLDEAAIEAVHQWNFAPARDGSGRPLRVIVQIPVRFALR